MQAHRCDLATLYISSVLFAPTAAVCRGLKVFVPPQGSDARVHPLMNSSCKHRSPSYKQQRCVSTLS